MGGGQAILYPHFVLHLPSFSSLTRPKFRNPKPLFPVRELADWPTCSSTRADGNGTRRQKNPSGKAPKADGLEDDLQPFDGKSSLSPNKEKILALFKRIQASISKGETVNSKKRNSRIANDNPPSAEAIFEVLHQSRTQGKGKSSRKDSPRKEERAVYKSKVSLKSTRPRSSFTRRSPIPAVLSPRDNSEQENEALPAMPIPREEIAQIPEEFSELKEMNLAQLKQVAKYKGIRGYSKLRKIELLELLTRALNNTSS